MSSGKVLPLMDAMTMADDFIDRIRDVCAEAHVVGSIRRRKEFVNDVEILVRPTSIAALWNRLEVMLSLGSIKKWNYGNGYRWGQAYRGVEFYGAQVEIFTFDAVNRGFQQWLRTGPGDANQYVMSQMVKHQTPIRFSEGYGWWVTYDGNHPAYDGKSGYAKMRKLMIPNEFDIFKLLGMEFVPPKDRSVNRYRAMLARGVDVPDLTRYVAEEQTPQQKRLF